MYKFFFLYLSLSLILLGDYANADSAAGAKGHLKELQEKQKQNFDTLNNLGQPKFLGGHAPKKRKQQSVVKESRCWKITKITVRDSTVLSKQDKQRVIKSYLGHCLGLKSIKNLLGQFTFMYIRRGYITSKVIIKPQNLADGSLDLVALEGRVAKIVKANPKDNSFSINTAFPELVGKILNLRDFEQGLEQLNRLVGVNVTMDYVASTKNGYTDVVIFNKPGKRIKTVATFDTFGSDATGRGEGTLAFSTGNILKANDLWSISLQHSLRRFTDTGKKSNIYLSLNIPYGYWNLLFSMSRTHYDSLLKGQKSGIDIISRGDSTLLKSQLTRTIYRNSSKRVSIKGSVERSLSNNFVNDAKISSSSFDTTTMYFGVESNLMYKTVNITASLGVSKIILEARKKTSPSSKDFFLQGAMNFTKSMLSASGTRINLRSEWTGQYAFRPLLRNGLSLGGRTTVRGPKSVIVSGDIGIYVRNTATYSLSSQYPFESFLSNFGVPQPYQFLDFGYAYNRKDKTKGYLVGGGFGLKLINSKYNIDLSYSRLLARGGSNFMPKGETELLAMFTVNL